MSEHLKIERITKNTYRHITYLSTDDFGLVACNGMIVIDNEEALIFDSPANDRDSKELIEWTESYLKAKVIGVVATHYHEDCLGGLREFHRKNIPSYASLKTIELAKAEDLPLPQVGFEKDFELTVGRKKVTTDFLGAGHTRDNIVVYFPSEKVLFGGCLIKSIGASKGNLADANVKEWPYTVEAVSTKYKEARFIIPGHGKPGGRELLDYTVNLFKL